MRRLFGGTVVCEFLIPNCKFLISDFREGPADEKHRDAGSKQARARAEGTSRKDVDDQYPHPQDLSKPAEIVDTCAQHRLVG